MQAIFPKNIFQQITDLLYTNYPIYEAESLAYMIMENILKLSKTAILMNEEVEYWQEAEVKRIVEKLLNNEPIQYALGYADFYGNKFIVNENVLIPRQETEELVRMIIHENQDEALRILDIGTGSGCIGCSLALEMNRPEVFGLDVSNDAIDLAKKNVESLKCGISFILSDILTEKIPIDNLDIIVSNPPYVTNKERQLMHKNILEFEPELALFVPDENPLLFYQTISHKSKISLKSGGKLYFEINELFGSDVAYLMENNGFENVKVYQDLNGKDRFVSGKKY